MDLITILHRCRHFRGFVYQNARFSADHKSIEIGMRPHGTGGSEEEKEEGCVRSALQFPQYVPGQYFVDFSMAGNRLRNSCPRILVPIVFAAVAYKFTAGFLQTPDQVGAFH
jgi:hypothetical protein